MNRKPPPSPSGTASKIARGTASKVAAARRTGQDAAREGVAAEVTPEEKARLIEAVNAFLARPETGTVANLAQRAGVDGSNLSKALRGKTAMSNSMALAVNAALAGHLAAEAPKQGPSDEDVAAAVAALKAELEHPLMVAAILGDVPGMPEAQVEAPAGPDFSAMDRPALIAAMRDEAAALKAWEAAGGDLAEGRPARPATPALDWHAAGKPGTGPKAKATRTPRAASTSSTARDAGEITCTGACGETKPATAFPTINAEKRGTECRKCRDARKAAGKGQAQAAA